MATPETWHDHAEKARQRERPPELTEFQSGYTRGVFDAGPADSVIRLRDALVAEGLIYVFDECATCGFSPLSGRHRTKGCDVDPCPDPSEHHAYVAPPDHGLEQARAVYVRWVG